MTLTTTTIELLSQASSIGRARIADVLRAGVPADELFRLQRLGLVDLLPAARPLAEDLPTITNVFGTVQLEYVNLI
jgi:hypothetical protein